MKMKLADHTTAMLPLTPTGTAGALLVRAPVIIGALREYFEMLWERATPLTPKRPAPVTDRLTPAQLTVLRLMAEGLRGNLLRDGHRIILADWDAVSTGPREVDLIPTLQASRFGLPAAQRDAFIAAYGHDIRSWAGYPILREIRELSTISALLRDGHSDTAARRELQIRIRSVRTGDDQQWTAF